MEVLATRKWFVPAIDQYRDWIELGVIGDEEVSVALQY